MMKALLIITAFAITLGADILYAVQPAPAVDNKILVEVPDTPEDANCILSAGDFTVGWRGQTGTAQGTVTGGCLAAWSSGVDFAFNKRMGIRGKSTQTGNTCNREVWVHGNRDLNKGVWGNLTTFTDQGLCIEGTTIFHRYDAKSLD